MKVLLIAIDLYRIIGGGQVVYKKIIEASPDIEFYYFRVGEKEDVPRPANVKSIPLSKPHSIYIIAPPPYPVFRYRPLMSADCYARAVAGMTFDIVDLPDFHMFGHMLQSAFRRHKVEIGRFVLAMHGNLSVSLNMGWGSSDPYLFEHQTLEREQFLSADGIYGISPRYIRQWQKISPRAVHYLDPLHFVDTALPPPAPAPASGTRPNLYCVGRMERRKGNDLFLELTRWLSPALYGEAVHIGEEDFSCHGISSRQFLNDIANSRGLPLTLRPPHSRAELAAVFAQPSVIVLPVRYDTLNLVALEAIFSGCPIAVSSEAGVCDYLDEYFPSLPYVKIDFSNFYASVAALRDLLEHYDEHRARLRLALEKLGPVTIAPLRMETVYRKILEAPRAPLPPSSREIHFIDLEKSPRQYLVALVKRCMSQDMYWRLKGTFRRVRAYTLRKAAELKHYPPVRMARFFFDSLSIPLRLRRIAHLSEGNPTALHAKLTTIYSRAVNPLIRCNFWLDIARLQRMLGNDLNAVTYELRALRLVGSRMHYLLPQVVDTLRRHGFTREAQVAGILYGNPGAEGENVTRFLQETYEALRTRKDAVFETLDDRRDGGPARVAVIVSLYNAAPKLRLFLTALAQQTLTRRDAVEIILIDSGSPAAEYDEILSFLAHTKLNLVYARSAGRETIQAAWNRGIGLARAPYLVFLGVDETLYPEALETLAAALDESPETDWVMADSLVTEVDAQGVLKKDIMTYDRRGGTKDHTYLETCYLSWVGGMYRASVHERFGYYDDTFAAAGDTEFKNRILPHIRVRFIPRTLGLFLNYPDERTTASPRAEIEDLRAWYVHRTLGGVRYAFGQRADDEAKRLFFTALGYRKSFCRHTSCDLDYAAALAQYLSLKEPGGEWSGIAGEMNAIVETMRGLEFVDRLMTPVEIARRLIVSWWSFARRQREHRQRWRDEANPVYKIYNDNRFEQHSWLWK